MSTGMDEREIARMDVDEVWLREWAQSGVDALEVYLAKHAAFTAYLRRRADLESNHDGSAGTV